MPIEIRELVIKTSVNEGNRSENTSDVNINSGQDMSNLIAICVEKVLEILKEKSER